MEHEANRENFQLLERSSITVAGIEGELIVYLVDRLNRDPTKDDENLDYVHAMYRTRYAKLFYSPEELQLFTERWSDGY